MSDFVWACARCASRHHRAERFCGVCGLPLGITEPDAGAGLDALGPYEAPDPSEPDASEIIRDLVYRAGFEAVPFGHGWRLLVQLHLDRRQAVYVGPAGIDQEGQAVLALVSVCGPANERDLRTLLKLNARMVEGRFAIKLLRGEEYFVVIQTLTAAQAVSVDSPRLVRRIASAADDLEDRLSRGRDIY